jgi:hypothetical protein
MTTTFFVDVFAWGTPAQVQAAFRQVRAQVADLDIHVCKAHQTTVGLDQLPGLPQGAVGRVLPLVVEGRGLSPVLSALWSDTFLAKGGAMAVMGLNLSDPSPATGWIHHGGTVMRQGWDVPQDTLPGLAADGLIELEGPKGADQMGEKLLDQFVALPAVQSFLHSPLTLAA